MNALDFLNTSEGVVILYILMAMFLALLIILYKLVKARELLVDAAKLIDEKNKQIKALQTLRKEESKIAEARPKYSIKSDLRDQLIEKLNLSETSSEVDILFYVSRLAKNSSEEVVKMASFKDEWIDGLSKGDTYKTLEKISAYLRQQKEEYSFFEVIGYQNRINSLSNLLHKGVIKLDEYNLESSKINSAILEFIRKL